MRTRMKSLPLRMGMGKNIVGPDYSGCCNTGMAPAIVKSALLNEYKSMSKGYKFVVGPELYVREAAVALLGGRLGKHKARYTRDWGRIVVRFFKTYASAKKYFMTLVNGIVAENEQQRQEHQRLREAASKGDVAAALATMDY